MRLDLQGPRTRQEVPALLDRVEAFLAEGRCASAARVQLLIAIEEALVNVMLNGWPGETERERVFGLSLERRQAEDRLEVAILVEDDGIAFDPTCAPAPDIDASIEDRRIGGLGIFFMHEMTDTQHYARVAGRNRLRLTKSCPIEGQHPGPG